MKHYTINVTSEYSLNLLEDYAPLGPGGMVLQATTSDSFYVTFDGSTPSYTNGLLINEEGINLMDMSIEQLKAVPVGAGGSLKIWGQDPVLYEGFSWILNPNTDDLTGRHTVTSDGWATSDVIEDYYVVDGVTSDLEFVRTYFGYVSGDASFTPISKPQDFEHSRYGIGLSWFQLSTSDVEFTVARVTSDAYEMKIWVENDYVYATNGTDTVSSEYNRPTPFEICNMEFNGYNDHIEVFVYGKQLTIWELELPEFSSPTLYAMEIASGDVVAGDLWFYDYAYVTGKNWHRSTGLVDNFVPEDYPFQSAAGSY